MKTQGEFEAAICDGVTRFEQDCMGRVLTLGALPAFRELKRKSS
jgi:hypothetical protein